MRSLYQKQGKACWGGRDSVEPSAIAGWGGRDSVEPSAIAGWGGRDWRGARLGLHRFRVHRVFIDQPRGIKAARLCWSSAFRRCASRRFRLKGGTSTRSRATESACAQCVRKSIQDRLFTGPVSPSRIPLRPRYPLVARHRTTPQSSCESATSTSSPKWHRLLPGTKCGQTHISGRQVFDQKPIQLACDRGLFLRNVRPGDDPLGGGSAQM